MQQLNLYLRRDILTRPTHWIPRNFTQVEASWVLDLFPSFDTQMSTNRSRVGATFCSLGPISMLSSIQQTSVISSGRENVSQDSCKFNYDTGLKS